MRIRQSFDWLAGPMFLRACSFTSRTIFLHLQDQAMTNALVETLWRGHLLLWHKKDTCIRISSLCPVNVADHRHECNSSLKLFWIHLSRFQIFLKMCLRISIDVNPGKNSTRTQLVLHQFQTILCTRWIVGNNASVLST